MARWFDSVTKRYLEKVASDEEQTLRVDADNLVFAAGVELTVRFAEDEKALEAVDLEAKILPSQLLKMVKADALPGVTLMDLTKLQPMQPVALHYRARAEMLERLSAARRDGASLEDCLSSTDAAGFPAFLDLENYELAESPV